MLWEAAIDENFSVISKTWRLTVALTFSSQSSWSMWIQLVEQLTEDYANKNDDKYKGEGMKDNRELYQFLP